MGLEAIAFYVLATIAVAAALSVVFARNPVHSVLFLILTFFTTAGLFVLMGAEFLAMLLVVVYVGAVAVLFLFVVMMLDVNFAELKQGFQNYLPLGGLIAVILFFELLLIASAWVVPGGLGDKPVLGFSDNNARALGEVIYTQHLLLFQLSGLVLFVAMIGAVVLTLRHRPGVKRQSVTAQVGRTRKQASELKDVRPGQGLG
ncbi:MAG: NADH-quinone oxidoreductase subunit J [Caulobacterales bacterium]|jgi:NADH-quinone oxidoreductase subunit J